MLAGMRHLPDPKSMKLYEQGSGNLLKKGKDGKTVFYPYGMLSPGYVLKSDSQAQKISESIKEYNQRLFKFLFIPVFLGIVAISQVPAKYNWLVVSAVIILMLFWSLQYMRLVRKETSNLSANSNLGVRFQFDQKTVMTLLLFVLYALGVVKLAEIVQSIIFG